MTVPFAVVATHFVVERFFNPHTPECVGCGTTSAIGAWPKSNAPHRTWWGNNFVSEFSMTTMPGTEPRSSMASRGGIVTTASQRQHRSGARCSSSEKFSPRQ